MYIKICDICGRRTKNGPAFLVPTDRQHGSYQVDGAWFGEPIVLCNNCLMDFDEFRCTSSGHNHFMEAEESIEYLQMVKETKERLRGPEFNADN